MGGEHGGLFGKHHTNQGVMIYEYMELKNLKINEPEIDVQDVQANGAKHLDLEKWR
jgi:hypothetical protein